MRFFGHLPWRRPVGREGVREEKAASGFLVLSGEAGRAHWSGRGYGALSREGFMRNPVAHRAARMLAEAAASVSWLLYEGDDEIGEHALLRLLARPNGQMSGPDFFEALYGHLLLSGNGYIEPLMVGERLRELHLLRPDRVGIIEGADGWVAAYDYRAEGRAVRRIAADRDGLGLLHLKLFNPLDDHGGFSPLAAAGAALDLHNAASIWNKRLLDNSARPSGALVYQPKEGGNLSTEQYERLKRELEEGYAGAVNAGRPLLLEGGLDWKSMGLSPRDMDFMEAKNGAARDIALALGVPPMLLGIPGDNTYANYQEANRAFYRLTVLPLINRTAASLSAWLSPLFEGALRLEPDLDRIAGLSGERDALWARVGAAGFLSDEEKREAVGY
ncbi:phage portal protein [Agrobacterium rubi]|uniref:Phage portal protein n=1 Tax=Agrobacterium rubi TaxID=28099 RepID=A0AAE7UPZ7_9HYPH|nr:phage portal protein [Agrobacterium rubi]NTE85790.1 phage portal protein [Agrobacterium rubi]NTF01722.1 phage portal protein [Agrobacterium rubi]NTF35965.1 phage portal protein [Agrobacterium rubi]OCJ53227.1 phage portal protein [Agrobacterium rubi]QTG01059.1 phage portal protein [Agrobacterium rubi]